MTGLAHRALWVALFLGILVAVPACADKPPDPGATRAESQANELRERLMTTQIDR